MSNTPSNNSLRELNTKLLAEIGELRKKFAKIEGKNGELKNENAKLRQIIEENARHDAENAEHKIRIEELEKNSADILAENAELKAELAKPRHDFDSSNLTRPLQPQHVTNVQNLCSVGEEEISKVTTVSQPDTSDPVKDQPINGIPSNNTNIKSMEERKMDTFLGEVYKKRVSNEIRQRNRKKKLLCESAIQDSSSVMKDKKSQSHKNREVENIVQDAFDFTATSTPEKNHVTKIFMTGNLLSVTENTDKKNSKACDAEKQRIRTNQDEILCWYHYVIEFVNQVKNVMKTNRIDEKKVKGQIYDFIITQLGTKHNTLLKQTQRVRSIYKLFEKIGTYSANSISELSDSQIQTFVDYFSKNPNTELPDDQESSIIDSEEKILDDQNNALKVLSSKESTTIPLTHVSAEGAKGNFSDNSKEEMWFDENMFFNEMNPSKVNTVTSDDDVYFGKANEVNKYDGDPNSINDDSDSDSNSEDEIPDDSDDDGYNRYGGYGGYNEYGEHDRGYYYRDRRYERRGSPMMSPIISLVTI
ncbi:hypothetical protein C1645_854263 [Glomus cerebriforme]|uniref:Uncharacterized protein n=1 Tax=Glomus cerebriforme TaxID=658196 RepID=A0A397SNB1_9GLOM|nr:hypothetical protein C1645_854263 [Glomus cerebriforme]